MHLHQVYYYWLRRLTKDTSRHLATTQAANGYNLATESIDSWILVPCMWYEAITRYQAFPAWVGD